MNEADNLFFEEYKQLEKLCSEIFECSHGISEYISQMEQLQLLGRAEISEWDTVYKELKHIRHIRNRLSHESCHEQLSTEQDVLFMRIFFNNILFGKDPLALAGKILRQRKQMAEANYRKTNSPETKSISSRTGFAENNGKNKQSRGGKYVWIVLGCCATIGIIIAAVIYIIK